MEAKSAQSEPINGSGLTNRELSRMVEEHPEDQELRIEVSIIQDVVQDWKSGAITGNEALYCLATRYSDIEEDYGFIEVDGIPKPDLSALAQASIWLCLESGISPETVTQIDHEIFSL